MFKLSDATDDDFFPELKEEMKAEMRKYGSVRKLFVDTSS